MSRPNVLFLVSDQHRAMSMGAYGATEVLTPNLDRLADRGVRFERAYCSYPQCTASRQSMILGQYPNTHGCYGIKMKTIDYSQWTMQQAFTDAGYRTALVGHPHMNETGFVEDLTYKTFSETHMTAEQRKLVHDDHKKYPYVEAAKYARPSEIDEELGSNDFTRRAAIEFLRQKHDKPFYAWVTFQKPHPPFTPPKRFWDMYEGKKLTLPPKDPNRERHPFWPEWIMQPDMIRNYLHGYYSCITYMDWCMGEILQTVEEQGLFENTIIVYTSDHGDNAGHHGAYEKHCFYDPAIHIPLVMHWPGMAPGVTGGEVPGITGHGNPASVSGVVEQVVEQVDLAPTLTEMCGVNVGDHQFEGESLMKLFEGAGNSWKNRAFCDYEGGDPRAWGRMLLKGNIKCCIEGNMVAPKSLFNLHDDPDEFVNLWDDPDYREIRDEMVRQIETGWHKRMYQPPEP